MHPILAQVVEVVEGAAAGGHEPDGVCEALVVAVAAQRGLVPLQHRGARLDTNPVVGEHRPAGGGDGQLDTTTEQ